MTPGDLKFAAAALAGLLLAACLQPPEASSEADSSRLCEPPAQLRALSNGGGVGSTLYVPIALEKERPRPTLQSHALRNKPWPRKTAIAVRNTDTERPIRLASVCPYDIDGAPGRDALSAPLEVPPLAVRTVVVPDRPTLGVASVLVRWTAEAPVRAPLAGQLGAGPEVDLERSTRHLVAENDRGTGAR